MEQRVKSRHGSTSTTSSSQKLTWIERVFNKRECCTFIPAAKEQNRCGCGRILSAHQYLGLGQANLRGSKEFNDLKWVSKKHSLLLPTDAFGTIEFEGGPHPSKAQYVRLAHDTSAENIIRLIQTQWNVGLPKLLISVHGGLSNFHLQPKLKRVFKKGLLKAAKTTGAWVVTAGTDTGVMRHVGEALGDTLSQSRNKIVTIGIAPWGVIENRHQLISTDKVISCHPGSNLKSNSVFLNCNHAFFLLVDNGTEGKFGSDIGLRRRLEKFISQQKIITKNEVKNYSTPVVCLTLEGGTNTIRNVFEYTTDKPPVPVVVCDGSGRGSDLIAFTHKYVREDGLMQDTLRDQLILTIEKTFKYSREEAEQLYVELILCCKKKDLVTIFRMAEGSQDIDLAILSALLLGQKASLLDQLSLALTWNRVDIAKSHIFGVAHEWPEGSLEQVMMDALIQDRVDFVQLLLENGVTMSKWLNIPRLEYLYNIHIDIYSTTFRLILRDVRKSNITTSGCGISLLDIGLVIERLMGGAYRATYCRKKFKAYYHSIIKIRGSTQANVSGKKIEETLGNNMKNLLSNQPIGNKDIEIIINPFHELMVWAILLRRYKMAKFMWQHGEEALAKALIACKLLKAMAHEAAQDELEFDVANEIKESSREFGELAIDLLEYCHKTDPDQTQSLLTYELKNWSEQTCLSLAYAATLREFLANSCCQMLLSEMWMGALRMRKYMTLKVILGIMFFPAIFLMEYKSKEELQLMPQTVEEHYQDRNDSDSDSSSTDSDDSRDFNRKNRKDANDTPNNISEKPVSGMANVISSITNLHDGKFTKKTTYSKKSPLRLGKKIYEFYTAPVTKFWSHTLAYIIFLIMFTKVVLIKLTVVIKWDEMYVMAYVFTLAVEKIREIISSEPAKFVQKIIVYFSEFWNCCDLFAILLFIIGVLFRIHVEYISYGKVIFAVDIIFWYIRILDIFSVNKYLGPYVMMIGKMVKDMLYFIVILLVVLMSFGIARQAITHPNEVAKWSILKHVFLKPYFMLYGEVYAGEIDPADCVKNASSNDEVECMPGMWITPAIMTIYLIVANILLINLLIAVFNNIFNRVNAVSTVIWKFQRYSLVIEYEMKPLLPPPLIVISHACLAIKYCIRRCSGQPEYFDNGLKLFMSESEVEDLHDFEEECVDEYFRKKQSDFQSSTDQKIRITSDRVENMTLKVEDMNTKENTISLSIQTIDFRLAKLEEITLQTAEAVATLTRSFSNVERLSAVSQELRTIESSPKKYQRSISVHDPTAYIIPKEDPKEGSINACENIIQGIDAVETKINSRRQKGPYPASDLYQRRRLKALNRLKYKQSEEPEDVAESRINREKMKQRKDSRQASKPPFSETSQSRSPSTTPPARQKKLSRVLSKQGNVSTKRKLSTVKASTTPTDETMSGTGDAIKPFTPIITPSIRQEYSSITDEIDTSCVCYVSPNNSPTTPNQLKTTEINYQAELLNVSNNYFHEKMRTAEEMEHAEMERTCRRRMRQISLTESDSVADIAFFALENHDVPPSPVLEEKCHSLENLANLNEVDLTSNIYRVSSEPNNLNKVDADIYHEEFFDRNAHNINNTNDTIC